MKKNLVKFTLAAAIALVGANFIFNGSALREESKRQAQALAQTLEQYTAVYTTDGKEAQLTNAIEVNDSPTPVNPSLLKFIGFADGKTGIEVQGRSYKLEAGEYNGVKIRQQRVDIKPTHVGLFWTSYTGVNVWVVQ